MANPQPDQFTKISNELMEVVPYYKFNGTQLRLLFVILRYTYGFCRKEHALSLSFLSKATGMAREQVKRELNALIRDKVVIVKKAAGFNSTRILAFNKDYEQWKVSRGELIRPQGINSTTGNEKAPIQGTKKTPQGGNELDPQERNIIKENFKEIYTVLFEKWNSLNIIIHKELTPEIIKAIDKALKTYKREQIELAMTRYAQIYHDTSYFFNHKWSLIKFLTQGNAIPDFLDEGDKWENYKAKSKPTRKEAPTIEYPNDW